ncbi:hypothetical protein SERLA73DRAFT_70406 [Serpula lacrymans var. lacrymans S7.3]|uniref:Uncharacterized protein n=1 Tax=Serpula lacrymans var. lacrymans (strain S7.3) TaxID=936435 RepID=F8PMT4_SERL3|nr:hypothetical protein SERLA73DRAFT_70406 [Serpula lacrymans var. lacrymans S7.3]
MLAVPVEESKAQRLQRQQARFRDRGGIFVPAAKNTLIDILLSRTVSGESPPKSRESADSSYQSPSPLQGKGPSASKHDEIQEIVKGDKALSNKHDHAPVTEAPLPAPKKRGRKGTTQAVAGPSKLKKAPAKRRGKAVNSAKGKAKTEPNESVPTSTTTTSVPKRKGKAPKAKPIVEKLRDTLDAEPAQTKRKGKTSRPKPPDAEDVESNDEHTTAGPRRKGTVKGKKRQRSAETDDESDATTKSKKTPNAEEIDVDLPDVPSPKGRDSQELAVVKPPPTKESEPPKRDKNTDLEKRVKSTTTITIHDHEEPEDVEEQDNSKDKTIAEKTNARVARPKKPAKPASVKPEQYDDVECISPTVDEQHEDVPTQAAKRKTDLQSSKKPTKRAYSDDEDQEEMEESTLPKSKRAKAILRDVKESTSGRTSKEITNDAPKEITSGVKQEKSEKTLTLLSRNQKENTRGAGRSGSKKPVSKPKAIRKGPPKDVLQRIKASSVLRQHDYDSDPDPIDFLS